MYSVEEFDEQKTKIMKYIVYKRRTEQEVRRKFAGSMNKDILEDIIEYLKEAKYIDDSEYIERAINNFKILKNMSLFEVKNKLYTKGLNRDDIEDYFYENIDELNEYEINSARNIFYKKQKDMEIEDIKKYLIKKGYKSENIRHAIED